MRLPNAIVYPTFAAVAVLLGIATLITGEVEPLVRAGLAAGALTALFFAIVVAQPGGMGLGDVKLAAVIGAVLGFVSYPAVVVGVFLAFVLGGLAGAALIVARRAGSKSAIPLGPALVAGAVIALFASAPITDAYAAATHLA
jgi:leader peptidase (prepilin peptidase)/N-methyltransferase